jgi:hypothetical protein
MKYFELPRIQINFRLAVDKIVYPGLQRATSSWRSLAGSGAWAVPERDAPADQESPEPGGSHSQAAAAVHNSDLTIEQAL